MLLFWKNLPLLLLLLIIKKEEESENKNNNNKMRSRNDAHTTAATTRGRKSAHGRASTLVRWVGVFFAGKCARKETEREGVFCSVQMVLIPSRVNVLQQRGKKASPALKPSRGNTQRYYRPRAKKARAGVSAL